MPSAKRVEIRAEDALGRGRSLFVQRHGQLAHRPAPLPVTHDYVALTFCTGGARIVEQDGTWSLEAGDALLIPAGQPHRHLEARDAEGWGLGFCPACFFAEGAAELLEPFERVRSGSAAVVRVPPERRAHLQGLFEELHREVERPGSTTLPVQKSLVTLILAEIARASSAGPPATMASSVVADALRFIERRCLGPISLADVAHAAKRSPAHLTTLVRRATGRSVHAWIIAGRLGEARRRLRHTDELVEIIAERVGYADATHFIRLFRRAHGMTPAAWRARKER